MNLIPTCIVLLSVMTGGKQHIKKIFWYDSYEKCYTQYKKSCIKFSSSSFGTSRKLERT